MDKYDYKVIAAAKELLEQALELVQEAWESLDGADHKESCVIASKKNLHMIEDSIEDVMDALERGMHGEVEEVGTSDRQPTGIAAQLADGEREKIGPDALQRMADVFNGPGAER